MTSLAEHPGRILVVDDKQSVREVLRRVLTRAGHEVSLAENGSQALEELQVHAFDLLVVDKALPDMSGIEVLRQAKGRIPNLQALVITGLPTLDSRASAKALGVYGYIVKPFDVHDIASDCAAAIEAGRREAQSSTLNSRQ